DAGPGRAAGVGRRAVRGRQPPFYVVLRICDSIAESWNAWDGNLALQGVDPSAWTLKRMLNAAAAAMDMAAEDDAARERNTARLYAPPRGARKPGGGGQRPARTGMSMDQVRAMMASVATEDAQLTRRRSG